MDTTGLFPLWDWSLEEPLLGLLDIALGRYVPVPTTIYLCRNQDRSGVMGLLLPDGESYTKRKSTCGRVLRGVDEQGERFESTVVWDGAQPEPPSKTPIGWRDKEETRPIFRGKSKGLLLGRYGKKGDGWDEWRQSAG